MSSSSRVHLDTEPDVRCLVCTRPFTLDTEVNDSFEALAICRECKATVLNDNNRDEVPSVRPERRRRRTIPRTARFESFEAAFSQRLSHLFSFAAHEHEGDVESSPPVSHRRASSASMPNLSQRWHASDDEGDVDSVFGENESNLSFGDYGGESDASVDQHARVGREIVIQLDNGTYLDTDTDVDPMNAAMDLWDSDDQEDEQSEESDFDEIMEGPAIRRRHFIGNPGDYVTARQFEMLLDQLADDNNTRRGAPPAAKSVVENLPSVVIPTNHETNGGVTCPVCKDNMPSRTVARQLPCMHLYHSSCILPWLSYRNTCPVCRYELRTDDLEYERSKQAATNERGIHGVEHIHLQEPTEEISHEHEVEGAFNTRGGTLEDANMNEHSVHAPQHPNGAWGHHRWLVIAAAPVVSLVGLALVLCFANSSSNARRQLWRSRSQSSATAHVDTKRSWWSIF